MRPKSLISMNESRQINNIRKEKSGKHTKKIITEYYEPLYTN